jgi:pimeloyl-ACP methyl ester carboxylesterase
VTNRAYRIERGGVSIGLRERGEGEPVLFVHGTGLSSRYWGPLASQVATRRKAVTVDLLGYGETDPWSGGDAFHFHRDRDVVIAALEAQEMPAHVVGHSYGGLLALQAALARPELVRSLSLYEPVAFGVLHSAEHGAGLADMARVNRDGAVLDSQGGGSEAWLRGFVEYWNGAGAFDAMTAVARAALVRTGRKAFLEVRSTLLDRTSHAEYARIARPFLLMNGAESPLAARATVTVLARAIPGARRLEIPGAGHLGPFTHGDVVGPAILAFLD